MAYNTRRAVTGQPAVTMKFEHAEFDKFINRFIADLSAEKKIKALLKIGLDVTKLLIKKTPVDTGRARAGWYFAAAKLSTFLGVTNRFPAGSSGSIRTHLRGLRKSIEIINSVKYIMPLEYGWSGQAPYGMVRITMQIIRRQLAPVILGELQGIWKAAGVGKWTHWRAAKRGPAFRSKRKM